MSTRISLWKLTDFEKAVGEKLFADTLSCFSCPQNRDVEESWGVDRRLKKKMVSALCKSC